ncbi:MAG: DUF4430 domain-containing protein [Terriglobia bacterium]
MFNGQQSEDGKDRAASFVSARYLRFLGLLVAAGLMFATGLGYLGSNDPSTTPTAVEPAFDENRSSAAKNEPNNSRPPDTSPEIEGGQPQVAPVVPLTRDSPQPADVRQLLAEKAEEQVEPYEQQSPRASEVPRSESRVEAISEVKLIIDHGSRSEYSVEIASGATVYDLLDKASRTNGFSLRVSQHSSFGVFVEEIDGVANDKRAGKYWLYYLNGDFAALGASVQTLDEGDVVLWKYKSGG